MWYEENEVLTRYKEKRHFDVTPEPSGEKGSTTSGNSYLIQKHAASHLHYDVRLEFQGVLKSWAVTKGPSLNPHDRRLAVHVEDHPVAYGSFEGTIPKGQYGGGTVMLWDRGTWEPMGDPEKSYANGHLDFRLYGERLKGIWHLVRMGKGAQQPGKDNWLLIKGHDDYAVDENGDQILRDYMTSVATGRTMEEIARQPTDKKEKISVFSPVISNAFFPNFVEPELATAVPISPSGDEWLHEIKYDGYRILSRIEHGNVQLLTRRGHDWTEKFRVIADDLHHLPVESALLDGEIVMLTESGVTDFKALQNALKDGTRDNLSYYIFDLLYLNGKDLTSLGLTDRKAILRELLGKVPHQQQLLYSDHIRGKGEYFFEHACQLAVEGAVSKRADAPYRSGRGRDWLKAKCIARQEFVIGGFTKSSVAEKGIGSLLLGYYQGSYLRYAGRVGTGFTEAEGRMLLEKLTPLLQVSPPFINISKDGAKDALWVKPQLICEVAFLEWTTAGSLRHASYKGLREDKQPEEITKEEPFMASANDNKERVLAGVRLTHADKQLFPEIGLTKEGLANYYDAVSQWMLPHISHRPISIIRCPSGWQESCFFQRHKIAGLPDSIKEVEVHKPSGNDNYIMVDDLAGIMALVQLGAIEFHPWGCRAENTDLPDRMIFDLDPDEGLSWATMVHATKELRSRLTHMGLTSYLKTTGGKGLHITVPIQPRYSWAEVKQFAKDIANTAAKEKPVLYTASLSKEARKNRVFIDYLRNDLTATAVAPYSARARKGAPVATPLAWDELSPELTPDHFTVDTVLRRLKNLKKDPWEDMMSIKQELPLVAV